MSKSFESKYENLFSIVGSIYHKLIPDHKGYLQDKNAREQVQDLEKRLSDQLSLSKILLPLVIPIASIVMSVSLVIFSYNNGELLLEHSLLLIMSLFHYSAAANKIREHIYSCKMEWYAAIQGLMARKSVEYTLSTVSKIIAESDTTNTDQKVNEDQLYKSLCTIYFSKQNDVVDKISEVLNDGKG